MLQYNKINNKKRGFANNRKTRMTRLQFDRGLNFNLQRRAFDLLASHTAPCKLMVGCRQGDFGDGYG